jgi:excisionase family DNA binding protein
VAVVATTPEGLRLLRRGPAFRVLFTATSGHLPEDADSRGHRGTVQLQCSYREAGEVLSYSERHIRRLVASGQLRAVRSGNVVRIPFAELEAFVARQLESEAEAS